MGFDIYGLNPNNPSNAIKPEQIDWSKKPTEKEKDEYFYNINEYETEVVGSYFRNNVWWWRPLWDFVCDSCDDILTEDDMEKGCYNDGRKINKTKSAKIANRLFELIANGTVDKIERELALRVVKAEVYNKEIQKQQLAINHDLTVELALEEFEEKWLELDHTDVGYGAMATRETVQLISNYQKIGKSDDRIPPKEYFINLWMSNLDNRSEPVPGNYSSKEYKEWEKLQEMKNWDASYPFHKDNVRNFAIFCLNSGGFEIS